MVAPENPDKEEQAPDKGADDEAGSKPTGDPQDIIDVFDAMSVERSHRLIYNMPGTVPNADEVEKIISDAIEDPQLPFTAEDEAKCETLKERRIFALEIETYIEADRQILELVAEGFISLDEASLAEGLDAKKKLISKYSDAIRDLTIVDEALPLFVEDGIITQAESDAAISGAQKVELYNAHIETLEKVEDAQGLLTKAIAQGLRGGMSKSELAEMTPAKWIELGKSLKEELKD